MTTPTCKEELTALANMWVQQADDLENTDGLVDEDTGEPIEEIDEATSNTAETLRHCAGELRTLLSNDYSTKE